jgi:hypothetical protein
VYAVKIRHDPDKTTEHAPELVIVLPADPELRKSVFHKCAELKGGNPEPDLGQRYLQLVFG